VKPLEKSSILNGETLRRRERERRNFPEMKFSTALRLCVEAFSVSKGFYLGALGTEDMNQRLIDPAGDPLHQRQIFLHSMFKTQPLAAHRTD